MDGRALVRRQTRGDRGHDPGVREEYGITSVVRRHRRVGHLRPRIVLRKRRRREGDRPGGSPSTRSARRRRRCGGSPTCVTRYGSSARAGSGPEAVTRRPRKHDTHRRSRKELRVRSGQTKGGSPTGSSGPPVLVSARAARRLSGCRRAPSRALQQTVRSRCDAPIARVRWTRHQEGLSERRAGAHEDHAAERQRCRAAVANAARRSAISGTSR